MKKIVVKIGRSIATSKRNKIDAYRFEQLAKQIKMLHEHDISVVLVVSAAVCCGEHELGLKSEYTMAKQLVAGVGQTAVMAELYSIFKKHNIKIGQLLITKNDLENEQKRSTVITVLNQAAEANIVVVVNENDIIELHSFGGNDYLAAGLAKLVQADDLLLLTDVDGVLDENMNTLTTYSKEQSIAKVEKICSKGEIGGMQGKINAAMRATEQGITSWIINGRTKDVLVRMFLQQNHIGTKVIYKI